ncbi:DUF3343 domain-containing protein [Intestinirhabdus alba]|jgi:hypothetical protein|uniref:DUF3343 domain-containing protein n=1 Tax=Intestinirhabdus alba TaxID=2899544 RepID=A0A6L6IQZ1_9ENTR|nr:DUF3343 domain-containing protein [Intestinirhabdus alba]MTH48655.1 DUF3343 domain-containing protein [Intestinirhabdus alba]
MSDYLYLFHATPGVIQTRRLLHSRGVPFRVTDIPRQLRGGCGLCIILSCAPGEEIQWVLPGHTAAIYRAEAETWRLVASFDAG